MTPPRRRPAEPAVAPARTPAEAAERFRAAGYRVSRRRGRRRTIVVELPSLLPYLFVEHGPQTRSEA
jgi:hypothetical protein